MDTLWKKILALSNSEIIDVYNYFVITDTDELLLSDSINSLCLSVYDYYDDITDFLRSLDLEISKRGLI